MGAQVPVAEREPGQAQAVAVKFLSGPSSFVGAPPTACFVIHTRQGVHHGIQVRADAQTAQPHVIAHIGNHANLCLTRRYWLSQKVS